MAMNPDIQEKVSSRWQRLQGRYTSYLTNIYVRLVLTHTHGAPAVFIDEKSLTQIMIVKDWRCSGLCLKIDDLFQSAWIAL